MKIAIIENEIRTRKVITTLVNKLFPNAEIVGEAESVAEGINIIGKKKPDLILLDVEIIGGTGFTLLESLKKVDFKVIFITAYDQYALKAIKFSALDYILKPINSDEFKKAINKYESSTHEQERIGTLISNIHSKDGFKKIAIPISKKIVFIDLKTICRFEAEGSYTKIFTIGQEKYVSSKPIKEYEELLKDDFFFRVHRSHLINLHMVKEFDRNRQNRIILLDSSEVEISRKYKAPFMQMMRKVYRF